MRGARGAARTTGRWLLTAARAFVLTGPMKSPAESERLLDVGGEQWRVRLRPRQGPLFDYDYDWLTGPNDGYGFGMSGPFEQSDDQHEARIRDFLAEIDPATGYLAED